MDYCTVHFGKKLNDLTIDDISVYFQSEHIETDQLEFKSLRSDGTISEKITPIQKTVCAFLNSSGGLIIWGSPEGVRPEGRKEKVFKGELTFLDLVLEKDYVISKISDAIIPMPASLRIKILEASNNKSMMVFEVDASNYAPHQTSNTYYMRIDGQSRPAPHHYIEAIFKKITYPNIEVFLKITKAEIYQSDNLPNKYRISFCMVFFNWSPLQNEENLYFRVVSADGIFFNSLVFSDKNPYKMKGHEYFMENAKSTFYFGEPIYEPEELLFDPMELTKQSNKSQLVITFGGKYSPMKSSEYELDFTYFNHANPNRIIVSKKENRLSKDVQDEKGISKETMIQTIMKHL